MNAILQQLRDLDPSDPGRWPLAARLIVIVAVLIVAGAAAAYLLAWSPKQPILEQAQAEEVTLRTTLEGKAKKAANLDAYKQRLKEMEQSFGAMLRQLPNKAQMDNLIVDISQTGLSAGLEEKLFTPTGQVNKDFYAEVPIKIRLTGSFHAMGSFVSGIAALPRIVTLHDIQITPVSNKKAGGDDLQLEVVAKTYKYLDDEEVGKKK
jgi:type IV pilus assembly protein PilO